MRFPLDDETKHLAAKKQKKRRFFLAVAACQKEKRLFRLISILLQKQCFAVQNG